MDKRTLFKAAAWVEKAYHDCLLNVPEAEPARRYFQDRGITAESIEKFQLGFAPMEWDWILQRAGGSASRANVLELIGVLGRASEGGNPYQRFRGRGLFPIHDPQGRSVGLGGRLLPGVEINSPAKYYNTQETTLFRKSRLLYALDLAKDSITKSRTALVMEGYTDVIIAHQYGFTNAVAVLGTALGDAHIRALKPFASRIVLMLDGDDAGQKRTNEVLELFVAQQVDLQILTLPDNLDPCDFLIERGAEAFANLLANGTVDALDHAFHSATRGIDLDRDVHAASQALERLIGILAKAPRLRSDNSTENRLREAKFLERLAVLFRIHETDVRRRLTEVRRTKAKGYDAAADSSTDSSASPEPSWRPGDALDTYERELIELLILYPDTWSVARDGFGAVQFTSPVLRSIFETGCRLLDDSVLPDFDRLILEFDDPAVKSLLVDLDEQGRAKGSRMAEPTALMSDLLKAFHGKEVERQRPGQLVALREGNLDNDQQLDMLERIMQQQRSRQGISDPMEG